LHVMDTLSVVSYGFLQSRLYVDDELYAGSCLRVEGPANSWNTISDKGLTQYGSSCSVTRRLISGTCLSTSGALQVVGQTSCIGSTIIASLSLFGAAIVSSGFSVKAQTNVGS
jgi:hypothetical protein